MFVNIYLRFNYLKVDQVSEKTIPKVYYSRGTK